MYTPKERVRVVIGTSAYQIEGDVHILAGGRLTDLVNVKAKDFWAITNATIKDLSGERVLYEVPYGVVSRDEIVWLFPLEEPKAVEAGSGTGGPSIPI